MKVLLEIESLDMPDNEETRNHVREVVQKCLDQQFCKELKIPVKFTTWTANLKVRELDEVMVTNDTGRRFKICPVCRGRASRRDFKCDNCDSTGRLPYKEKPNDSNRTSQ